MRLATLGLLAACSVAACSNTPAKKTVPDPSAAVKAYAATLYAAYGDAVTDAVMFQQAVESFLTNPTESTLTAARTAWLESRAHYMLTEGARFYGGPIDAEPANPEAALNAWPLDEAYIDYTTDADGNVDETAGLVNHPDLLPTITVAAIDELNAQGADTNISNGYHAAEFLLWGQALVDVGPGTRPATDYVFGGPRPNADRRAAYLRAVISSIIAHLTTVRDAWAPDAAYRKTFEAGGLDSVALIITGLGKMSKGELMSERIRAPFASKSRRDQHDCFSSLTLIDYTRDAEGVQQLYLGTLGGGVATASASDLVKAVDPDLDTKIRAQLQESIDLIKAIPAPFEASIVGADTTPGRKAIQAVITALSTQGDLFASAATSLGLSIQIDDED